MRCPNCGEMNEPGARFCFNCGTRLEEAAERRDSGTAGDEVARDTAPPQRPVQPTEPVETVPTARPSEAREESGSSADREQPAAPQYPSMQAPGPAAPQYPDWQTETQTYGGAFAAPPERRRRSPLLMITLGILLGCLILCVGLFVYGLTPSGQDFFEDVGTSVADMATEAADS